KLAHGPAFRPIAGDGRRIGAGRLTDRHVARLVQRLVDLAGIGADIPADGRAHKYGGHSLRAGLASSAEVEERHVQKHLGHASVEMTRRYQRRRERFRINLTKASGL
ncbi:MAG: tyrosine-type recombinase/integrase, partial [Hyphomicrobiales bacterium]|nr:tyrosine-type recombinase/integrase [Hyphomicrobiales bacterium]